MHIQSVTTHYHALQSDVPDENGEHMQLDTSVHPPRIIHLHLALDNWDGDEIIESFPVYVVTDRLGKALSNAGLSSFTLRNAEIALAPEEQAVLDRHGISELPNFQWLDVTAPPDETTSASQIAYSSSFLTAHWLSCNSFVWNTVSSKNTTANDSRSSCFISSARPVTGRTRHFHAPKVFTRLAGLLIVLRRYRRGGNDEVTLAIPRSLACPFSPSVQVAARGFC